MHSESRPNTPMICFLSMGSDPTPSIEQLAKRLEIVCKSISMGQGQEVHARKLLQSAKTEVCLHKECIKLYIKKSTQILEIDYKLLGFLGIVSKLSFGSGIHGRNSYVSIGNECTSF